MRFRKLDRDPAAVLRTFAAKSTKREVILFFVRTKNIKKIIAGSYRIVTFLNYYIGHMITNKNPEKIYSDILDILLTKKIPFMIGGTYALSAYTGLVRKTKDMDIIATHDDYPKILKALSDKGFETQLHSQFNESDWLAKVIKNNVYTDIIYGEKNGLEKVDKSWLTRAGTGDVFGHIVKLVPIEEMIRSKAYIQHKERFDGSDVINLILKHGETINWKFLKEKMEPNWEILFAHLINFLFVYPNDIHNIPKWLIDEYSGRLNKAFEKKSAKENKLTRGLLISSQYDVAVKKWGYKPISPLFNNLYEQREKD